MAKHTLKILRCEHRKIFKVCLAIFQHYAIKGYVKDIYGKNDQMFKCYIGLFTCATTRNVHLELTPSMDASDVIKALVQFLSRRGCIKMFASDNF